MKQDTIFILGVNLDQKNFPKLYQWAQANPKGLEGTLRSLAKASGGNQDDLTMDAINLESDLAHG
ncbi:MAG: hypothetical protein AAB497_02820 [Patescibacteria group bacterium]